MTVIKAGLQRNGGIEFLAARMAIGAKESRGDTEQVLSQRRVSIEDYFRYMTGGAKCFTEVRSEYQVAEK